MAKRVQLRRGTTAQTNDFTGAIGEVTVDTDKEVLVVHDGTTAGGFPVAARANTDGTISLIKKDGTSAGVINATGLFNDTITSTNTNQALTAAQGKLLSERQFGRWGVLYMESGALNTVYTNSGTSPMLITVVATIATAGTTLQIQSSSGFVRGWSGSTVANGKVSVTAVVPSGLDYKFVPVGTGAVTINAQMQVW